MSDRLTVAHAFEAAGFDRDQAEMVATAVLGATRDNVATKTDIAELQIRIAAELRASNSDLKYDLTIRGLAALVAAGGIMLGAMHLMLSQGGHL